MLKSITHRPLWFNILIALGIVVILFVLFMLSLRWITRHGHSKTVPAVIGKNINDVEKMLSDGGFETIIQDSVYYDSLPPGIVVKQVPEPDQVVKVNRTVYVVINRFVAPDIAVPNLIGYTFRNAEMTLNNLGLKMGDTTFVPDFAKGSVKQMTFNGNPLKPGDKLKVGSKVDLVLAGGMGNEDMSVPKLIGLTLAEARIQIEQLGLVMGATIPMGDIGDKENAYVARQNPMPRTSEGVRVRIRPGQMMDLWIQTDPVVDSTSNQNPQTPEQ